MDTKQGNLLDSLRGIQAFLDEHADALGTIPQSGARQKLDAQVAAMHAQALTQGCSRTDAKNATFRQNQHRQVVLHGHMEPIARVAAAELATEPALAAFKMPMRRLSTPQLRAFALGMADSAEPHAAVFTASGLPDDFVAQLRTAANDLRTLVDSCRQSRSIYRGATASLKELSSNARLTVRVLDALVRRQLQGNTQLLAQWSAVKRLRAKTGKSTTAPAWAVANA